MPALSGQADPIIYSVGMDTRSFGLTDRIFGQIDKAIKVLGAPARPSRPAPAAPQRRESAEASRPAPSSPPAAAARKPPKPSPRTSLREAPAAHGQAKRKDTKR